MVRFLVELMTLVTMMVPISLERRCKAGTSHHDHIHAETQHPSWFISSSTKFIHNRGEVTRRDLRYE